LTIILKLLGFLISERHIYTSFIRERTMSLPIENKEALNNNFRHKSKFTKWVKKYKVIFSASYIIKRFVFKSVIR